MRRGPRIRTPMATRVRRHRAGSHEPGRRRPARRQFHEPRRRRLHWRPGRRVWASSVVTMPDNRSPLPPTANTGVPAQLTNRTRSAEGAEMTVGTPFNSTVAPSTSAIRRPMSKRSASTLATERSARRPNSAGCGVTTAGRPDSRAPSASGRPANALRPSASTTVGTRVIAQHALDGRPRAARRTQSRPYEECVRPLFDLLRDGEIVRGPGLRQHT